MKLYNRYPTKAAHSIFMLFVTLAVASCSSNVMDEPGESDKFGEDADTTEVEEIQSIDADENGMIYLHKDMKVAANTNFTMEQFEQELFGHEAWEEITISSYRDGKWNPNHNGVEGTDFWTPQSCFEFLSDGTMREYVWPSYSSYSQNDTAQYLKWQYRIDKEAKGIYVKTAYGDSSQAKESCYKLVAVDSGRIVLDYEPYGYLTRKSLQPCEINKTKVEYNIHE